MYHLWDNFLTTSICCIDFDFYVNFIEYRLIRKLGEGTFSEVLKA